MSDAKVQSQTLRGESASAHPSNGVKRPRNDKRRARNREKLIEAAIAVAVAEGPAALTPLLITTKAGLHRRAFYAHFEDVPRCIEAMAQHVGKQDLNRVFSHHMEAIGATPPDQNELRRVMEESLRQALPYVQIFRLFVRCRYDDNALGAALRESIAMANANWSATMWEFFSRFKVKPEYKLDVQRLAEHLVENQAVAIMRLSDGSETDPADLASRMASYNRAIVTTELRRMLGKEPVVGDAELLEG